MDSFIAFIQHKDFAKKLSERGQKGLSRLQRLAYYDYQDRVRSGEITVQAPAREKLTRKELVTLYSVRLKGSFTAKQFSNRTGINYNTTRREIQEAIRKGAMEKGGINKNGLQEYRYT